MMRIATQHVEVQPVIPPWKMIEFPDSAAYLCALAVHIALLAYKGRHSREFLTLHSDTWKLLQGGLPR